MAANQDECETSHSVLAPIRIRSHNPLRLSTEGQTVPTESPSADPAAPPKPDDARGRSTIEFPYFDLTSAIEVARAVKNVGGSGAADWTSVAVKLNMAGDGGGFRQRVMTGKSFGLVDYSRGSIELTELGLRIVDPQYDRAAKVDAFLRVPLYKVLFDKLNGQTLPPAAAIERMAEQAGVAPKQKDKARQVFMRSAKQAGFFEISSERLATPPGLNGGREKPLDTPGEQGGDEGQRGQQGGGGGGGAGMHPFIQGLLQKLPEPETDWAVDARAKWLTAATNIFDLMYADPSNGAKAISIEVTKEGAPGGGNRSGAQ